MKKMLFLMMLLMAIFSFGQTPLQTFNFENNLTNAAGDITLFGVREFHEQSIPGQGQALQFNQSANGTSVCRVSGNITNMPIGNTSRTFSFWLKVAAPANNTDVNSTIFQVGSTVGSASPFQGFGFYRVPFSANASEAASNTRFEIKQGTHVFASISGPNADFHNKWRFYTITFLQGTSNGNPVGGDFQIFLDSALLTTADVPGEIATTGTSIQFGGSTSPTNTFSIDKFKIYGSTLTPLQITTIYKEEIKPFVPSPQALCSGQSLASVDVQEIPNVGSTLRFYRLGNLTSINTQLVAGDYQVDQVINGVSSNRASFTITLTTTPPPASSAQSFCTSATVANLTATGTNLKWYAAATGGTQLAGTTALATGNYFVSQTVGTCESARTSVTVTAGSPAAPTGNASQSFTQGATIANLNATGTAVVWFASAVNANTNTNALAATTTLVNNTTYFAVQTVGTCRSTPLAVTVTITSAQSPQPTAASPQTFCNGATVASLAATGTDIKWYANATGGSPLVSSTVLAAGTYYVTQTQANSTESTRLAVTVNLTVVNPPSTTNSQSSFCVNPGINITVTSLSATGTGTISWFNAPTGGTALASSTILATGTYYASQTVNGCTSARTPLAITVTPTVEPVAPALQTFCTASTIANLTVTGPGTFDWFTAQFGGSALASTTVLVTQRYWVQQTTGSCTSNRIPVDVIAGTPAPTASAQSFCNSATVANLTATGTDLKWYAAATGGTQLASTTALATGNYFVSQTIGTCESTRTSVAVTVTVVNAPTASAQSFCNSATVANLVAAGTDLKWYAAATGGTQLASTTALATGNYFVSQTIGTCESTRTSVAATVTVVNAPTASAQSFCNSATVANLTATGTDLKWYAAATGGSQLASTTTLSTGNYFVSQTIGNCESTRTSVAVTVTVVNAPTGATSQTFVQGATVANLVANGTAVVWFASAANANANTNALATTTTLVNNTTYFAVQTVGTCRSTPLAVAVTVTLSTNEVNKLNFTMYPNPASDVVTIELDTQLKSVEIYSIHGQKIQSSTNKTITINNIPTGVYLVKVEDVDGLTSIKKLIKK